MTSVPSPSGKAVARPRIREWFWVWNHSHFFHNFSEALRFLAIDPSKWRGRCQTEVGHLKEEKEVTWPRTTRPIEQYTNCWWPPVTEKDQSPDQLHGPNSRESIPSKSRRNRAFPALEIGVVQLCKEHIPHKGNDTDHRWRTPTTRRHGTVVGETTSSVVWVMMMVYLCWAWWWFINHIEDLACDKLGECLKKTTVRSQDQRRMLQTITHSFSSNYWRNKITKGKESDKCDLWKSLQIAASNLGTYTTHVWSTLRNTHSSLPLLLVPPSHRLWELDHLSSSEWSVNGEKSLHTIWAEIGEEFPGIFNLCTEQTLENAVNKRPDGLSIKYLHQRELVNLSSWNSRGRSTWPINMSHGRFHRQASSP
jgi:hypothetical protein